MIHLNALPGTPMYKGSVEEIVDKAVKESETYYKHGVVSFCKQ